MQQHDRRMRARRRRPEKIADDLAHAVGAHEIDRFRLGMRRRSREQRQRKQGKRNETADQLRRDERGRPPATA
jgi:hypothetical protein